MAKAINGEIINADSMQVYQGVPIITNKHPVEEREGVPHHVMDHVAWDEEYFIHRYSDEAHRAIDDIHSRGKVPIVIGGTHYYLQDLLFNNKTMEKNDEVKPVTLEQSKVLDGPVDQLFETLERVDPVICKKFHPKDQRKLRRALEIYYTTGKRASDIYKQQKEVEYEDSSLKYNTLLFWLYCDPDTLRERLDSRVDDMMTRGAKEEVLEMKRFYDSADPKPDFTSGIWQVIGFKEFLPWMKENTPEKWAHGIERMKIRTRQYAKYQVKWIKKLLSVELHKEARFSYKYGGRLYLLDATDLTKWLENVGKVGIGIAKQFIEHGPLAVLQPQAPTHLMHIIPDENFHESYNSNKKLESSNNWKHYECPVCKDKQGSALVAVGEENWNIHLKSRRHKRELLAGTRKRKHEEMVAKAQAATIT